MSLAAVVMSALTVLGTGPAASAHSPLSTEATSVVGVSSARPQATATGDSLPLGRVTAAGRGTHRVYATFDLTQVTAFEVNVATIYLREVAVTNCRVRPSVTATATDIPGAPITWQTAPGLRGALPSLPTPDCPALRTFDARDAILDAIARGEDSLTVQFRLSGAQEEGAAYGRTVSTEVALYLDLAAPMTVDADSAMTDGAPCATAEPGPMGPGVRTFSIVAHGALSTSASAALAQTEFAWWPVSDPSLRRTGSVRTPAGGAVSTIQAPSWASGAWAWQARVTDGSASSAWSATCYYEVDATGPAAPALSYPEPVYAGVPVTVTIETAADVACVQYGVGPWQVILPIPGLDVCSTPDVLQVIPGQPTTLTISPEMFSTFVAMRAYDAYGNASPLVTQTIESASNAPSVRLSQAGSVGEPLTFTITGSAGFVASSYEWTSSDGQSGSVPGAGGTAEFTVTFADVGPFDILVQGISATGAVSRSGWITIDFAPPTQPTVFIGSAVSATEPFDVIVATGDPDIACFQYGWSASLPDPASGSDPCSAPDAVTVQDPFFGTTIHVVLPSPSGATLTVRSWDTSGLASPTASIELVPSP